ncbi:CHC2-type zinc finger protein [Litorimonas taeanensis]|uniref:CHC2-type zinc finger protein n=1 Tax=Litorimonas taeanensis TaxID=568099 RepID=A0A420WD91_9PROT|nr:CHC2 zinc finger domain-containing protein [Litorimonas taeanensis]RKQ68971.1 CHC2-type zinc finger protein [Litorimonas taeanensis]
MSGEYKTLSAIDKARLIARIDLRSVIGRSVKLKREDAKKDVGLSPFSAERSPSFKVWCDHYHCFSTSSHGDIFTWLMTQKGLSFPQAIKEAQVLAGLEIGEASPAQIKAIDRDIQQRDEDEAAYRARLIEYAQKIISESRPATGTIVETYLYGRDIRVDVLGGLPKALGYHPSLKNRSGEVFRAMTHPVYKNGVVTGAHVTFLKADGSGKIDATKRGPKGKRAAKQMYGDCFGGAAPLWGALNPSAPSQSPQTLNIGEGLESVMAARQLDILSGHTAQHGAYWAGLSLGNVTGAQARDKYNRPLFTQIVTRNGVPVPKLGLPRGVPKPDLNRPGFVPPDHWNGSVRIIAEDDLKDDLKNKIPGTQRAQEAFHLASAKFNAQAGVRGVWIAWPPAGCDANDALQRKVAADNADSLANLEAFISTSSGDV